MITNLGDGNVTTIVNNAADVEISGLELELTAQISRGRSGFLNTGFIDAEFSDFTVSDSEGNPVDNSGLELRNAPESTLNVGLDYYLPMGAIELGLHYNYRWRDEYHTILNNDERGLVDAGGFHSSSVDLNWGEHFTHQCLRPQQWRRALCPGDPHWHQHVWPVQPA
ncbi:hypothetical protein A3709_13585 [Halioglobus sp. HI00S01]|nr:hypothetical protein A3709_13585 [Halioglobus sp. HI00S01]